MTLLVKVPIIFLELQWQKGPGLTSSRVLGRWRSTLRWQLCWRWWRSGRAWGGGGGGGWHRSNTFHTYNFLISILHTQFTPQDWLGMTMTTDEAGWGDGETRKILRTRGARGSYYFILFPGLKEAKDDEEYERLMLVYRGSYYIVVLIKIHLTRQWNLIKQLTF